MDDRRRRGPLVSAREDPTRRAPMDTGDGAPAERADRFALTVSHVQRLQGV